MFIVEKLSADTTLMLSILRCEHLTLLSSVVQPQNVTSIVSVMDQECPIIPQLGPDWHVKTLPLYPETVMIQIIMKMKWKHISIFYDDEPGDIHFNISAGHMFFKTVYLFSTGAIYHHARSINNNGYNNNNNNNT